MTKHGSDGNDGVMDTCKSPSTGIVQIPTWYRKELIASGDSVDSGFLQCHGHLSQFSEGGLLEEMAKSP